MTHKEFFDRYGKHNIDVKYRGYDFDVLPIEELYQMFKERLLFELKEESSGK